MALNHLMNDLTVDIKALSVTSAGSSVITAGNLNLPKTNQALSQGVINSGGNRLLHEYDGSGTDSNVFVGISAGAPATMTAASVNNTGLGMGAIQSLTTGADNAVCGWRSGRAISTGIQNSLCGSGIANSMTTGNNNAACGYLALSLNQTGSNNCVLGASSLQLSTAPLSNVVVGYNCGNAYGTNEANNILLSHNGVVGDSGRIRIGTSGTQKLNTLAGTRVSAETSTAGTNVILAAGILSGIQIINAATTTDSGSNIDTAIPGLVAGDVVKCLVLNNSNAAVAITAGAGNVLGGSVTNFEIPAKASRLIYFQKTGAGAYSVF